MYLWWVATFFLVICWSAATLSKVLKRNISFFEKAAEVFHPVRIALDLKRVCTEIWYPWFYFSCFLLGSNCIELHNLWNSEMDKMNVNERSVSVLSHGSARSSGERSHIPHQFVNLSCPDKVTETGMRLVFFFSQQALCESEVLSSMNWKQTVDIQKWYTKHLNFSFHYVWHSFLRNYFINTLCVFITGSIQSISISLPCWSAFDLWPSSLWSGEHPGIKLSKNLRYSQTPACYFSRK